MASISVLVEGYFKAVSKTRCHASSTITLVQSDGKNIIVDTGNPQDEKKLLAALQAKGLRPEDIAIVIPTHFHPDHVGCNHLFKNARFVIPGVAFWDDVFDRDPRNQVLGADLELIPTPGHAENSSTLLVRTPQGVVACVGDLFWCEHDTAIDLLEEDCADKELFYENRKKILGLADHIIPGHGKMFSVKR